MSSAVTPEGQRNENRDPGEVNQVKHRGPKAGGHNRQATGRRRQPADQTAAPLQERQYVNGQHRVHQQHGEHRAPYGLSPGVPAPSARAAQVQPDGQAGHAGDLRPAGPRRLSDVLIGRRVAGEPAVEEGGDHVLFPLVPVPAGQQPQHPPVPPLQAAAHPAAPAADAPARPSLARTTRAVAARSSASSASACRPSLVSR